MSSRAENPVAGGDSALCLDHTLPNVGSMKAVLAELDALVERVVTRDPATMTVEDFFVALTGTQRAMDRLTAWQARTMTEADRRRFWVGTGARNMADWLSKKTKSSYGEALNKAKLGEALDKSPGLADAVANGHVSVGAAIVVAPTIVAPPSPDADVSLLIDQITGADPRYAKTAVEDWKNTQRTLSDEEFAAVCYGRRAFRYGLPDDGMITGSWTLPTFEARQVIATLSAIGGKPSQGDGRTSEQRLADGLILLNDAYAKGEVKGGRERPTIVVAISAEALAGINGEPAISSHGDRIPADVIRHLAEDALIQRIVHLNGKIVSLSTPDRFATEEQWKFLVARDGGCVVDDCTIPAAWCDADHLIPAEHGGPTELWNLDLKCRFHHVLRHMCGVCLIQDDNGYYLELPNGDQLRCRPKGILPKPAAAA